MATSPTQRSLKKMRADGYTCQVVERWCHFSKRRIDLYACIDIVCIRSDTNGIIGLQTTSASNLSARRKKALDLDAIKIFLEAGNTFLLHGWRKGGPRGKVKKWICREEQIKLTDLSE